MYKSLHGLAPVYLCELVQCIQSSRNLRSSLQFIAKQKSTKELYTNGKSSRMLYKDSAFDNLGPQLFNLLPLNVRSSRSIDVFKSRLKTYLFNLPFNLMFPVYVYL